MLKQVLPKWLGEHQVRNTSPTNQETQRKEVLEKGIRFLPPKNSKGNEKPLEFIPYN